eukprot:TRINITY_DN359_c0_g1_i1.p1 TRINITY_DN359_c0_g1~~TRINITY_DN359_c0_g1_i1.p1  ORF type:complete len:195 (-),score=29.59 TRINITY_DN359_c0_g1_i1:133-717(-)
MDSLIGLVGQDFVLLAADKTQARSILILQQDHDKILKLDSHKAFAMAGEQGDRSQFTQYIQKNMDLYRFRTGQPLTTNAAANFTRTELSLSLRRNMYIVNLLLGGWDLSDGASLYFIDYLGSMHQMPFAAHGYASNFVFSILDKYYKPGLNLDDALRVLRLCIEELKSRFLINAPFFSVKVVDKDGVREVSLGP